MYNLRPISLNAVGSSANATPEFAGRGGEELGSELSSTLYKVFNNVNSLELRALCIAPREHCWVLYVDVLVSGRPSSYLKALLTMKGHSFQF